MPDRNEQASAKSAEKSGAKPSQALPPFTAEMLFASDPKSRWLPGLGLMLAIWLFLLYAESFDRPVAPVVTAPIAVPDVSIAPVPTQPLRPPPGQLLWGRFLSDCWLQAIVGERTVMDRFFQAGDRLRYSGEMPDLLVLGSASAEIWLLGKRLTPEDGERRETAIIYRLKDLAARAQRAPS